ncbi:class I SAM-dependent methyltransferase [Aerophototrophica crusticola]|uniref:Class I SAM-dependent methyltransferase n=1 Tax=Aerophototrophica crusticola TaxID=1709002 RepID=A0A858RB10_9PROT|nr:class I SAM-dependent methyltransferase [Rhodospirillaceae bacterium B3]
MNPTPRRRGALAATGVVLAALLAACAPSPATSTASPATAAVTAPAGVARHLGPAGTPAKAFPKPRRQVAGIVAPTWGEGAHRDRSGEADTLFEAMRLAPGQAVADIGAGSGYHVIRLARRLGPQGTVYAQDIMPDYLDMLSRRLVAAGVPQGTGPGQVALALGEGHDPRLPPGSLDRVLMAHMYHEIEQPFGLLYNLAPALRPGALVAVLEIDRDTARHGTPLDLLTCEFKAVGYRPAGVTRLEDKQRYVALFEAPETPTPPAEIKACRP